MVAVVYAATSDTTVGLPTDITTALNWGHMIASHLTTPGGLTGDSFTNDGDVCLYVKNTNAATCTVTVDSGLLCSGDSSHDVVQAVALNEEWLLGEFPVQRFGANPAVTFSSNYADMRVAMVRR